MNRKQRREEAKKKRAEKQTAAGQETYVITKKEIREMAAREVTVGMNAITRDVINKVIATALLTLDEVAAFSKEELQEFMEEFNIRFDQLQRGEIKFETLAAWADDKGIGFIDPESMPEPVEQSEKEPEEDQEKE